MGEAKTGAEGPASAGPDRLSVTLDLDRGVEPISGRLADGHGNAFEFVGWLGLSAALEQLLRDTPEGERAPAA